MKSLSSFLQDSTGAFSSGRLDQRFRTYNGVTWPTSSGDTNGVYNALTNLLQMCVTNRFISQ